MRREECQEYRGEGNTQVWPHGQCGIYIYMCRKKKKEEKMIDRKNVKYGSGGGDDKTE